MLNSSQQLSQPWASPHCFPRWQVYTWVWSSSCFMLGLSGDYWNLMDSLDSFSMKVDFRSQHKEGWGRGKVSGRTYFRAQPGWPQRAILVKELPTRVIFTVNLTIFLLLIVPAPLTMKINEKLFLHVYIYICSCNEGRVSLICIFTCKCVYL